MPDGFDLAEIDPEVDFENYLYATISCLIPCSFSNYYTLLTKFYSN